MQKMKFDFKYLIAFFMLYSCSVSANIKLILDSDISLLAVNGKEVAEDSLFSSTKQVELENGTNQILIRLNVEFVRSGESEFISSDTHVILFKAEDAEVNVSAPVIKRDPQLKRFNVGDQWILTGAGDKAVEYRSAVLKKDGFQLSRNYEYELRGFNESNNTAALKVNFEVDSDQINSGFKVISESDPMPIPEAMLKYWYMQTDEAARQRFKSWLSDK